MSKVDEILKEAAELPVEEKLVLAHRLLISSEPAISDEIERAWDLEIRDRIGRYDTGVSSSRPASDVFNDIRRRLQE